MYLDLPVAAALACLIPGSGLDGIEQGPLGLTWNGAVIGEFRRREPQGLWLDGNLSQRRVACARADDVELLSGDKGLEAARWYFDGMPSRVLEHRVARTVDRLGGQPMPYPKAWSTPGLYWSVWQGESASWLVVRVDEESQ